MAAIIALCTCPDQDTADRLATGLVEEHLAACVNRVAGVVSTYRWQGKLCRDEEQLLIIKTTRDRFDALRERIVALHPYELPEVIALDITTAHAPYLTWIEEQTRPAQA
jgi:periplasmic divalent cation tolerance protein